MLPAFLLGPCGAAFEFLEWVDAFDVLVFREDVRFVE
jgi:hypothetical protein